MNTITNFLKYQFGKVNHDKAYHRLREDYIVHDSEIINKASTINGLLHPKYSINKSKGILGELNNVEVNKICDEIKKDGYYIFPNLLNQNLVEELREFASVTPMHYMEVTDERVGYSKEPVKYKESKTLSNRFQILNISNLSECEKILDLVVDDNFLHIANNYLGSRPILDIITMWWSSALKNVSGSKLEVLKGASAQKFHIDMDRLKFLKFFVYLTDVDTNNGPHVYVKGTHNKIPKYIKNDGRYSDELIDEHDKQNVLEICGKAGSIIAVDTRGLHKGKELNEGERLIFQIEFTNSLFGNPNMPVVPQKFKYNKDSKFFKTYQIFFDK